MMQIQDLEMIEMLTIDQSIDQSMINRVQGGLGLSLTGKIIGLEDMKVISWKSLHKLLENGRGSVSVVTLVGTTALDTVSLASSNATISVE
jgi:hypothetical protein